MDDQREEAGSTEQRPPGATWWPSDLVGRFGSVSLDSKEETPRNKKSTEKDEYDRSMHQTASQILWSTGMLSEPIPNGFYSVVPVSIKKSLCYFLDVLLFVAPESLHAILVITCLVYLLLWSFNIVKLLL